MATDIENAKTPNTDENHQKVVHARKFILKELKVNSEPSSGL